MMAIEQNEIVRRLFLKEVSNAPLIIFRVMFGLLMAGSIIRFALKGWVQDFYISPKFYFPYQSLEWIKPLPPGLMPVVFIIMFLAAMGIMLGLFYQASVAVFLLTFTYVELLDKANYLNHYYFVSLVAFLLLFVPAHSRFSLDVIRKPALLKRKVPLWNIQIFRLQVGIVYFYAGLAKLNYDWLISAMPMRIWLPANSHIPVLGYLFKQAWVAYFFSWFGALYDIFITFFLLLKKTRPFAYATVVVFHLFTALLFPIGIFPFVMIFSAVIFFPSEQQDIWLCKLERLFAVSRKHVHQVPVFRSTRKNLRMGILLLFFLFQLLFPWRFLLYPGNLYWTEQGYRFSWRVMLMEKAGFITFKITDPLTNHSFFVDNKEYLTPQQEKMMATQPDMILQYAHFLEAKFQDKIANPVVTAASFVTLNGRMNKRFIDAETDLTQPSLGDNYNLWLLPYEDN